MLSVIVLVHIDHFGIDKGDAGIYLLILRHGGSRLTASISFLSCVVIKSRNVSNFREV